MNKNLPNYVISMNRPGKRIRATAQKKLCHFERAQRGEILYALHSLDAYRLRFLSVVRNDIAVRR